MKPHLFYRCGNWFAIRLDRPQRWTMAATSRAAYEALMMRGLR